MCNGIILVDKIDILTKELGITRREFAKQLDINPSTIATWRTRNILPPMETIEAIADYFKVSIEWLVSEDSTSKLFDSQKIISSRKAIRDRVYELINSKTPKKYETLEELHNHFFIDMPEFTFKYFYNWSEGRININEYVFKELAFRIGISLDYLISGTGEICHQPVSREEAYEYIYQKALLYQDEVLFLSRLTGSRKKLAREMLYELQTLERLELDERHRKAKANKAE